MMYHVLHKQSLLYLNETTTTLLLLLQHHHHHPPSQTKQKKKAHWKNNNNTTAPPATSSSSPTITNETKEESTLEKQLKTLIISSEVMLFMKGTPTSPKCGFSRQTVELLTNANIVFGYFDILSNEDVRQGLKTFSDWPTYPQLYVRGELIGGLDILKDMMEDGNLAEQLDVTPMDTTTDVTAEIAKEPTLEERIQTLITKSRIMLFMKGVPSAPKCGFSRQIVDIIESYDVPYDTFNILTDEEIRQGLKKYSDWPTYPQLYVDGDLIGGLDIVKEMEEGGDLNDLFKGA
uniref:Glutaredoxin domain-containing protein n=2 Tax=Ditylum brightwellii TaxID=49249 RepID=A0A6V2I295_9STRA